MCAHGYVRIGPETSAIVGKCLLLLSYPPSHVPLPRHRQCIAGRIAIVQVEPWQQPGRVRREERESGWMDGWMDGWMVCLWTRGEIELTGFKGRRSLGTSMEHEGAARQIICSRISPALLPMVVVIVVEAGLFDFVCVFVARGRGGEETR